MLTQHTTQIQTCWTKTDTVHHLEKRSLTLSKVLFLGIGQIQIYIEMLQYFEKNIKKSVYNSQYEYTLFKLEFKHLLEQQEMDK